MNKINLKGVNKEAITGILILLLALVNATLQMFGIETLPINNEEVSAIISTVFLIVTALYNTWKNRNLTTASQTAQNITDAIKNGEILADDIMFIMDKVKENK
jgi:SPP1 family holin